MNDDRVNKFDNKRDLHVPHSGGVEKHVRGRGGLHIVFFAKPVFILLLSSYYFCLHTTF